MDFNIAAPPPTQQSLAAHGARICRRLRSLEAFRLVTQICLAVGAFSSAGYLCFITDMLALNVFLMVVTGGFLVVFVLGDEGSSAAFLTLALAGAAVSVASYDSPLGALPAVCLFLLVLATGGFNDAIGDLVMVAERGHDIAPEHCPEVVIWCRSDDVVLAYQRAVANQGRSLTAGEYESMKKWVDGTEERLSARERAATETAAHELLKEPLQA